MQILSPKRRIDILRDVILAKEKGSPYVITFCGVNGVGKSTNLAKVKGSRRGRDTFSVLGMYLDFFFFFFFPTVPPSLPSLSLLSPTLSHFPFPASLLPPPTSPFVLHLPPPHR